MLYGCDYNYQGMGQFLGATGPGGIKTTKPVTVGYPAPEPTVTAAPEPEPPLSEEPEKLEKWDTWGDSKPPDYWEPIEWDDTVVPLDEDEMTTGITKPSKATVTQKTPSKTKEQGFFTPKKILFGGALIGGLWYFLGRKKK